MRLSMPFTILSGAAVIPLAALAIAGCGSDNSPAAATPPKTSGGHAATIGAESGGGLGKILVDSQGRTIYLFEKDTGRKSTCSGECAVQWPPVTVNGTPKAGRGVQASQVGTTQRSDGKMQVTYSGHPLYLFEGDHNPGDVNGEGLDAFGAPWYVVSPSGTAVKGQGSISAGGGNGY
jgi:predicted lipoprotein with Yx(FWY)xxD motif